MRKHALVRFVAFHVCALMLLLLLGAMAHRSMQRRPAVMLFESPLDAPRVPARPGRAPQPLKRRVFLPPAAA
jgi:hypothetical protein